MKDKRVEDRIRAFEEIVRTEGKNVRSAFVLEKDGVVYTTQHAREPIEGQPTQICWYCTDISKDVLEALGTDLSGKTVALLGTWVPPTDPRLGSLSRVGECRTLAYQFVQELFKRGAERVYATRDDCLDLFGG